MKRILNPSGFTLIELVTIIVILGIIASVAVPKYADLSLDAKRNTCASSLMNMRSAISGWNAQSIVKNASNTFPPIDTLRHIGSVLVGQIPPNPFQAKNMAPDSIVTGVTKGVTVGTRGGWAYKPSTGEIWPNTNTTISGSGCSGSTSVGENSW
jgi:prepilin-type N-terminal cleavage/methylation domain-containing protein